MRYMCNALNQGEQLHHSLPVTSFHTGLLMYTSVNLLAFERKTPPFRLWRSADVCASGLPQG